MRSKTKKGFTLLEVIISTLILTTVLTIVMETLIVAKRTVANNDTVYGLEMEARRILRLISEDLSNSSWYLPMDAAEKFDLLEPTKDREIRYYPYILTQTVNGMGDKFSHLDRADAITEADYTAMGLSVPNEHRFASREVVFVKLARSEYVDDIKDARRPSISFELNPAVPFDRYWEGPEITEMVLNLAGDTIVDINLNMEHNTSGEIREYTYGVRYDDATNRRQLCRYYVERVDDGQTSTTSAPVLDKVLSTNVDRIVVDTYRTNFSLEVDQILIQVWMSSRSNNGETILYKASKTFAMRSNVDPEYTQHIDAWLGTAGDFPVIQ